MRTFECVGHAAGWDCVSLHLENNKNQCQRNRHDKPLERSKNSPTPVLLRAFAFPIFSVVSIQFLPFLVAEDTKTLIMHLYGYSVKVILRISQIRIHQCRLYVIFSAKIGHRVELTGPKPPNKACEKPKIPILRLFQAKRDD